MKKNTYCKTLVLLGLATIAMLEFRQKVMAQPQNMVKIYDGRQGMERANITEAEKGFVEKIVRADEKAIKKLGEREDFQCAEDSFLLIDSATGSFTRRKTSQKAYLYQLCLSGEGKYATPLGVLIVIENSKPTAHFVFSGTSYEVIKALPDLNRNGSSELALQFSHNHDSLRFARSIMTLEVGDRNIVELFTIEIFNRLSDNDIAYDVFARRRKITEFYIAKYESEVDENRWQLTEKLKRFETGTPLNAKGFSLFEPINYDAPTLAVEDISRRILTLAKAVKKRGDISPANIEKITGIKVSIDPKDRKQYRSRANMFYIRVLSIAIIFLFSLNGA